MNSIGIDIGGTHIKGALVDGTGTVLSELRIQTPMLGPQSVCSAIVKMVRDLSPLPLPVGVGAPGVVDAHGNVYTPPNMPGWEVVPLAEMLRNDLQVDVFVDNDANCAAIAEADVGSGSGHDSFLYVTLGTGVGGCIVNNKQVFRGTTYGAGEIGHIVVRMDDTSSTTGFSWRSGTLEEYAGRAGIRKLYSEYSGNNSNDGLADIPEISSLAIAGNNNALRTFQETARILAAGFSSVLAVIGYSTIIVGGGIAAAYPPLLPAIAQHMKQRAIPTIAQSLTILPATFGNAAGVIGAALLAQRKRKQ